MVTLYTMKNCPKCTILGRKLDERGVEYNKVEDVELMLSKGFMSAPILEVDGEPMKYKEAFEWTEKLN